MSIELGRVPVEGVGRADNILFSESQSRFVVTVQPGNKEKFEKLMEGNVFSDIGIVTADMDFIVTENGNVVLSARIDELKDAWQKTLRW